MAATVSAAVQVIQKPLLHEYSCWYFTKNSEHYSDDISTIRTNVSVGWRQH